MVQIHPGPFAEKPRMTGLSCIWGLTFRYDVEGRGNKDGNRSRLSEAPQLDLNRSVDDLCSPMTLLRRPGC